MGGVFLIQYPIVDAQALKRAAAVGGERQPQVVAIDALVDLHRTKLKFARPLGAGQIEMAQHVGLERGPTGPQLAPADFAIAIAVQADRELAVTNRKFQGTRYFRALDLQAQEAVTGDVGLCERAGDQERQHPQTFFQRAHRAAPEAAGAGSVRRSRSPQERSKSSPRSSSPGLPAARAAATSTRT